jgi:hypothetical protein
MEMKKLPRDGRRANSVPYMLTVLICRDLQVCLNGRGAAAQLKVY